MTNSSNFAFKKYVHEPQVQKDFSCFSNSRWLRNLSRFLKIYRENNLHGNPSRTEYPTTVFVRKKEGKGLIKEELKGRGIKPLLLFTLSDNYSIPRNSAMT